MPYAPARLVKEDTVSKLLEAAKAAFDERSRDPIPLYVDGIIVECDDGVPVAEHLLCRPTSGCSGFYIIRLPVGRKAGELA